jgi:hypothetical protein
MYEFISVKFFFWKSNEIQHNFYLYYMVKKTTLLIALILISYKIDAQSFPALTIGPGEVKTLPAQTYIYSEINIKSGGTLVIQPSNSADWAELF